MQFRCDMAFMLFDADESADEIRTMRKGRFILDQHPSATAFPKGLNYSAVIKRKLKNIRLIAVAYEIFHCGG